MINEDKLFFTSDEHYGSKRTLELSLRPFDNTNEMDEFMIENFNKVVPEDGVIYHLGDFGDFNNLKRLNGTHVLILGNYEINELINMYEVDTDSLRKFCTEIESIDENCSNDRLFRIAVNYMHRISKIINRNHDLINHDENYYKIENVISRITNGKVKPEFISKLIRKISLYKQYLSSYGFESIFITSHEYNYMDTMENWIVINMTHEPVDCIIGKGQGPKGHDIFNLFGHIHGRQMVKRYGLDVGVDCHHFRPISFHDVLFYKNAIENHYDENVFLN